MSKTKFRKRAFEFAPQCDVGLPVVRLQEAACNIPSYGAVYDLTLRNPDDYEEAMETTLTIEELVVLRAHIDALIALRENDPARQNPRYPT